MGIYYSDEVRLTGGSKQHECRVVVTDTPDELLGLYQHLKKENQNQGCSLIIPRRGLESYKSKTRPHILLREEKIDQVRSLGAIKIPSPYMEVIISLLKKKFYEERSGIDYIGDEVEHYFELKIRSKVIKLLESEEWIDDPEQIDDERIRISFQKLNAMIEKIDLGRRYDLKYSSFQDGKRPNYGPRRKREYDWIENASLREWIDGSTEKRIEILRSRPWTLNQLKSEGIVIPKEILSKLN